MGISEMVAMGVGVGVIGGARWRNSSIFWMRFKSSWRIAVRMSFWLLFGVLDGATETAEMGVGVLVGAGVGVSVGAGVGVSVGARVGTDEGVLLMSFWSSSMSCLRRSRSWSKKFLLVGGVAGVGILDIGVALISIVGAVEGLEEGMIEDTGEGLAEGLLEGRVEGRREGLADGVRIWLGLGQGVGVGAGGGFLPNLNSLLKISKSCLKKPS